MIALDILAGVLVLGGSTLALTAAIGVVRFPDTLSRMHAATKPQGLSRSRKTDHGAASWTYRGVFCPVLGWTSPTPIRTWHRGSGNNILFDGIDVPPPPMTR